MNKIISSIAMVAFLLATVVIGPVQAAGIADANITLTYTVVGGANNDTLAVTLAGGVVAGDGASVSATLRNASTGAVVSLGTNAVANMDNTAGAANGGANGQITYTVTTAANPSTVTMTFGNTDDLATANYTVTVVSGTSFGVKVFSVGNANEVTVTAKVDPVLTFSLSSNSIALGTLSTGSTASSTHTMTAATNATSGYVISVGGATLTKVGEPSETITATSTPSASTIGAEQFAINLKDNTTPNVGAEAVGGNGVAVGNFATADSFVFDATGANTIANSGTSPTGSTVFTVSYIANIAADTAAGDYATTLTYTITPTF